MKHWARLLPIENKQTSYTYFRKGDDKLVLHEVSTQSTRFKRWLPDRIFANTSKGVQKVNKNGRVHQFHRCVLNHMPYACTESHQQVGATVHCGPIAFLVVVVAPPGWTVHWVPIPPYSRI